MLVSEPSNISLQNEVFVLSLSQSAISNKSYFKSLFKKLEQVSSTAFIRCSYLQMKPPPPPKIKKREVAIINFLERKSYKIKKR